MDRQKNFPLPFPSLHTPASSPLLLHPSLPPSPSLIISRAESTSTKLGRGIIIYEWERGKVTGYSLLYLWVKLCPSGDLIYWLWICNCVSWGELPQAYNYFWCLASIFIAWRARIIYFCTGTKIKFTIQKKNQKFGKGRQLNKLAKIVIFTKLVKVVNSTYSYPWVFGKGHQCLKVTNTPNIRSRVEC